MTIKACLYHDEVVFPTPDEIVNGRYYKRVPRHVVVDIDVTQPNGPIAYQLPAVKIAIHTRPIFTYHFSWGCSLTKVEMRERIGRVLLANPVWRPDFPGAIREAP